MLLRDAKKYCRDKNNDNSWIQRVNSCLKRDCALSDLQGLPLQVLTSGIEKKNSVSPSTIIDRPGLAGAVLQTAL